MEPKVNRITPSGGLCSSLLTYYPFYQNIFLNERAKENFGVLIMNREEGASPKEGGDSEESPSKASKECIIL